LAPKWKPLRKYDPLTAYLSAQTGDRIVLTYTEVEEVIDSDLPASATSTSKSTARTWWYADPGHCQADAWLNAGWRVCAVNVEQRTVTFARLYEEC
jgi:hypothetical protein